MENEQKDKPSFSFRQIFDGEAFVLGRPSFFKVSFTVPFQTFLKYILVECFKEKTRD